jgi:hypothetical protein
MPLLNLSLAPIPFQLVNLPRSHIQPFRRRARINPHDIQSRLPLHFRHAVNLRSRSPRQEGNKMHAVRSSDGKDV